MPAATLENMVSTLFTAAASAIVEAEAAYRRIWADWLQRVEKLIQAAPPGTDVAAALSRHLRLAPILKVNGKMELGLTMRIASVSEKTGSASVSLGVGPIGLSGAFGFMSRASEESIMQVRAEYTLTNEEVSLKDYLGQWSLTLASPEDVKKAIEFLGKA